MENRATMASDKNIRCHHCAGPLSKEMETSKWTVAPLIRDSFSMIGSAVGGTASAFYGFNHGVVEEGMICKISTPMPMLGRKYRRM